MIVGNFDCLSILSVPTEANAVLVVHANAVLADTIAFEGFKSIPGRKSQFGEIGCRFELGEFPQRYLMDG
jgi:hypothetical protein